MSRKIVGTDSSASTTAGRVGASVAGERTWRPPSLEADLVLLSVRVPYELRENLRTLAAQLRRRRGGGASQKRLPEQDIVGFALWMLGDAEDPASVEAVERLYNDYRRQRYLVMLEAEASR